MGFCGGREVGNPALKWYIFPSVTGKGVRVARRILVTLFFLLSVLLFSGCWRQGENQPPEAVISLSPTEGYAPLEITCDASGSLDPDGEIVSYEWDFGDGEKGSGVTIVHTYQDDGDYTVQLTVWDDKGATDAATAQVKVLNPPPVARFSVSPERPTVGEPVVFDARASLDPAAVWPKEVVSYHWNFGDGSEGEGVVVEHTYMAVGVYTVTLTVTDDDGATGTATMELSVSPPQPPPPPRG